MIGYTDELQSNYNLLQYYSKKCYIFVLKLSCGNTLDWSSSAENFWTRPFTLHLFFFRSKLSSHLNQASRYLSELSSDIMPAKRQKLRHRHVPLSEAFSVEDTPYVPPSNLTEHLGMKLQTERRMPKEVAPTRIPRPKKRNSRDPFHALNDDAVHLIIELLPARDTEIMRRVSKLWKASSEYRCGKSALVRHFPWAAPKAERCETNEAANLLFRRCCKYRCIIHRV